MRDNARPFWLPLLTWALLCVVSLSAHGQLAGSRALPVPQTEASSATSSSVPPESQVLRSTSSSAVLPVEEAFALTALFEGDTTLLLAWEIAPGHYLYRDKFKFSNARGEPLTLALPAATPMTDEYFGETAVYFNSVQLRIPLQQLPRTHAGEYLIHVDFQGCAKDLYCYPPTDRELRLALPH